MPRICCDAEADRGRFKRSVKIEMNTSENKKLWFEGAKA